MAYLPFARKYRPQNFDEVIGQDSVVEKLRQAILKSRLHHAYLFCGPRGVGKTSLARILAKCVNCQKGPTPAPCGTCQSCVDIQKGSSLDVIEIDGASNRGIDDIRELRENVKLSPASSRFKVYIIDEVHQITKDGFNALLKTLEEPPSHVKFIFATTEPHKVPLTIASRCQRFDFKLVPLEKIAEKLNFIAKQEGVKVDSRLIAYVSRKAQGSIRDAESIFDQILPLVEHAYSFEEVMEFLGDIDSERMLKFLEDLFLKKTASVLEIIDNIISEGYDLEVFLKNAIEYLRHIILAKVGDKVFTEAVPLPPEIKEKVKSLADKVTLPQTLEIIERFIEVHKTSKVISDLRIPLEVAVIKSTYSGKASNRKGDASLNASSSGVSLPKTKAAENKNLSPSSEVSRQKPFKMEAISHIIKNIKDRTRQTSITQACPVSSESEYKEDKDSFSLLREEVEAIWEEVKNNIKKEKMSVAASLETAEITACQGTVVSLGFAKNLTFQKEFVEKRENKALVENKFAKLLGRKIRIECVYTDKAANGEVSSPAEEEASDILNRIVDTFGGEVVG